MDPIVTVGLELILLPVLTLPLGLVLLRLVERAFAQRFPLSIPERALVGFYASGCFFLIAGWIPLPFYGLPFDLGALALGIAGYAYFALRDRGVGLRNALRTVSTWPAWVVGCLTLVLLVVELVGTTGYPVGNTLDGSNQALWMNVLLRNHTLPLTLAPYAQAGIEYPQTVTIWMSQPVILFGWPIVQSPLYTPALFLSLSVPAAYCLGNRWARISAGLNPPLVGVAISASFALIGAYPGMLIGGTFDYSFGLPLALVVLGWLPFAVERVSKSWKNLVALGLGVAAVAGIGPMLGAYLLLFVGALGIVHALRTGTRVRSWVARWVALVLTSTLFLLRSTATVIAWYSYPDHVLAAAGHPPYTTAQPPATLTLPNLIAEIVPFTPFKPKLSPFPWMSTEIQILLAATLGIVLIERLGLRGSLRRRLPRGFSGVVFAGAAVALLETVGLLLLYTIPGVGSTVASLTYLQEASQTLFFLYILIAMLPVVAALSWLQGRYRRETQELGTVPESASSIAHRVRLPARETRGPRSIVLLAAVLIVAVPLASGLYSASALGPGYISGQIGNVANVTQGDLNALEWAGANLPPCSTVLVAPASVGQYLPEFAEVRVDFPGFPAPTNGSYSELVTELSAGEYTNATHQRLVWLGITEVLVSGENSLGWPSFRLAPLEASTDFSVVHASGGVTILEFLPYAHASNCTVG